MRIGNHSFCKCNFPITRSVHRSVSWSICQTSERVGNYTSMLPAPIGELLFLHLYLYDIDYPC